VLAAGLWAGLLWGADGRLPLLVSGIVGAVFAVVFLAVGLRYGLGTTTSTSSRA
jgi:glycine/D-amino acid oxidase-like deaminating enzyme